MKILLTGATGFVGRNLLETVIHLAGQMGGYGIGYRLSIIAAAVFEKIFQKFLHREALVSKNQKFY